MPHWDSNAAALRDYAATSLPVSLALYAMPNLKKDKIIKTKTSLFLAIFFIIFFAGSNAHASSIEGIWQHASKPAVIEFNLDTGIASVKEHQTHTHNAGLTIIKNIVSSSVSEAEWVGEMFNGYKNKYVPVTIKLINDSVSIFDSQNNEVLKLLKE